MRKLLNKKGFTLVELMIVVVILGILVAVAVPIFNSVTKNARIKSCKSNQRIIKGNIEQYQSTGNNGNEVVFANGTTDLAATKPASLMALFEGGEFPTCPTNGTAYTVQVIKTDASTTYNVACADATEAADHNA